MLGRAATCYRRISPKLCTQEAKVPTVSKDSSPPNSFSTAPLRTTAFPDSDRATANRWSSTPSTSRRPTDSLPLQQNHSFPRHQHVRHFTSLPPSLGLPDENGANRLSFLSSALPPGLVEVLTNQKIWNLVVHGRYDTTAAIPQHYTPRDVRKIAEELAASPSPWLAARLLWLAHKTDHPPKLNAYECVAHRLALDNRWHHIPSLVASGRAQLGRTSSRLLDWKLRAIIEERRFEEIDRIFGEFDSEGCTRTRRTFHLSISGHLRNRNVNAARYYLRVMEHAGFPIDSSTHGLILTVYRSLGPDPEVVRLAFEAIQNVSGRPATHILNSLVQIRLDQDDIPGALCILDMVGAQDQSDRSQALPPIQARTQSPQSEVRPSTSITHVDPDVTTYTMLLNHLARSRNFTQAIKVIEQAHRSGTLPDTDFLASLVRLHFATQQAPDALAIVGRICRTDVPYSRFIGLGAAPSPRHLPFPTWSSLKPNARILNELADGLTQQRGLNGFVAALRIMRQCNIHPNGYTMDILLSHLVPGNTTPFSQILRVMKLLYRNGVKPTPRHYHIILGKLIREERSILRPNLWTRLPSHHSPERGTLPYRKIDSALQPSGSLHPSGGFRFSKLRRRWKLLQPIIQSLASHGQTTSREALSLRIRHEGTVNGDIEGARSVFAGMIAAGMHPNAYHYSALMEGYTMSGDMTMAVEILGAARAAGIAPTTTMFTVLIVGFARMGRPDQAYRILRAILDNGLQPDHAAVDALCAAYYAVGAHATSRRLLAQLWPHATNKPPPRGRLTLMELRRAFRQTAAAGKQPLFRQHTSHVTTLRQRRLQHRTLKKVVDEWTGRQRKVRSTRDS